MEDRERPNEQLLRELDRIRRRLKELETALNRAGGAAAVMPNDEEKYRQLFEMESDAIFLVENATGFILDANPAAEATYGYTREELLGRKNADLSAEPDETRRTTRHKCVRVPLRFHRKKDGTVFPVEIAARAFIWQGRDVHVAAIRDITERRAAEEAARKTTRALKALGQCNQAVIHATEESALLSRVCQIAVETAGYRLAWVGFAEHDEERTVCPVAQAGFEDGYLETVNVTWADKERGRGPAGTAARTGMPCVIKDTMADPRFVPWRAEATRRGYASCAGLPLVAAGTVLGALTIYAPEPDAFDHEELTLLNDLADNLAYGIVSLRTREAHQRAEAALQASHDELEQRVAQRTAELLALNARLEAEVAERKKVEQAIRTQLEVYEGQRKLVAFEIHDGVAQPLTGALMNFEAAVRLLHEEGCEAAEGLLTRTYHLLRESLADARRLMQDLRPTLLDDFGVIAAVDHLVGVSWAEQGIEIEWSHAVQFDRLAPPLETAIFRIAQEGLVNALRHSQSRRVRLELVQHGGQIRVEVEDWGVGFDPGRVGASRFGLEGIRQRARLFGGRAIIDSAPGAGTLITVELPVVAGTPSGVENGLESGM